MMVTRTAGCCGASRCLSLYAACGRLSVVEVSTSKQYGGSEKLYRISRKIFEVLMVTATESQSWCYCLSVSESRKGSQILAVAKTYFTRRGARDVHTTCECHLNWSAFGKSCETAENTGAEPEELQNGWKHYRTRWR